MVLIASETWAAPNATAWPSQWTTSIPVGAFADVQSNTGRLENVSTAWSTGVRAYLSSPNSVADAELLIDISFTNPIIQQYIAIGLRSSGTVWGSGADIGLPNTGYYVLFSPSNSTLSLVDAATSASLSGNIAFTYVSGATYSLRLRLVGTTLSCKVWQNSNPEPSLWTWTAATATTTTAGRLILVLNNGPDAAAEPVYFDNMRLDQVVLTGKLLNSWSGTIPVLKRIDTWNGTALVQRIREDLADRTGVHLPPSGNLTNWNLVYVDDFNTDSTYTQIATTYPRVGVYPDGSGGGKYQAENVTVSGSNLEIALHNVAGQGQGSALAITNPTSGWAQTYGRYSVRFRADYMPGFGSAMQLWPASNVWAEGETDFPEGDFGDQINGYNHQVGANPEINSLVLNTGASWQTWHVSTIEWSPTIMKFYLDGVLIGQDSNAVSISDRFWAIQAAEHGVGSAGTQIGSLQIDWVALYEYAP